MATHYEFITQITGTDVATFNCSNIFSAQYDIYFLNYKYEGQSSTGYIVGKLLDSGGTAISDSEYANAAVAMRSYDTFFDNESPTGTSWQWGYSTGFGGAGTATIFDPFDSGKFTYIINQNAGGTSSSGDLFGYKGKIVHRSQETISGVLFEAGGGGSNDFNFITVNVFGVK